MDEMTPVLKVDAHGAHVRDQRKLGGPKSWLTSSLSVKLAGLFLNKCIRTELKYMQL